MTVLDEAKTKMQKSVSKLDDLYKKLRGSGSSPAMLEDIKVSCYGSMMPLKQLAKLSTPEANTILIQPWDKETLSPIEKAIQQSSLSLNPSNDGKVLRIFVPPLSDQRRQELVKEAKNYAEDTRVSIRNIRRSANDAIDTQKTNSEISEDDQKNLQTNVQEQTDKYIQEVSKLFEKKEKEILEI